MMITMHIGSFYRYNYLTGALVKPWAAQVCIHIHEGDVEEEY